MGYRVKTGRPVQRIGPEATAPVQGTVRERKRGWDIAMTFDAGEATNETLLAHAADIMMGLLYLRGWRHPEQEMRAGAAAQWHDPWWTSPLGPGAFVVETTLAPHRGSEVDDLAHIITLTSIAWSMELDIHRRERPVPDLMTAIGPEGRVFASIHPEPLRDAMRETRPTIVERMRGAPEHGSATHAYVEMHLEGTPVRPWSLAGRACAFGSASDDPQAQRVFVALHDASAEPAPETARTLLRWMLSSGTD